MLSESLANLTTDVLIVLILGAILVMEVVTMLNQARQAGSMRKLEKQARNYMQEDLRIKRGQLEHEMEDAIAVQDPKGWLESVIGSVTGLRPELQELQRRALGDARHPLARPVSLWQSDLSLLEAGGARPAESGASHRSEL